MRTANKLFRLSLFASLLILLQLSVGCTGGGAGNASTFGDQTTFVPPISDTQLPFGDQFPLDDPLGTGTDIQADNFLETSIGGIQNNPNFDNPFADLTNVNPSLDNDCALTSAFPNGGAFLDPLLNLGGNSSNCMDDVAMQAAGLIGAGGAPGLIGSTTQLSLIHLLHSAYNGIQCALIPIYLEKQFYENPRAILTIMPISVEGCYEQIYVSIAGSPYYSQDERFRMQSFGPQWGNFVGSFFPGQ